MDETDVQWLRDHHIASRVNELLAVLLQYKPLDPGPLFHPILEGVRHGWAIRATASHVERGSDGLTRATRKHVPPALSDYTPTSPDIFLCLKHIHLGNLTEGYVHCPHCGRLTTTLDRHVERDHPDVDTTIPGTAVTMESILERAEQWVSRLTLTGELTQSHAAALHIYTMETPIYRVVNQALRENEAGALRMWADFIWYTTEALHRMPPHAGVVYRGIDCTVDSSLYVPEYVVTWQGFSSATRNAKVARDFLGRTDAANQRPDGTVFIVESMAGRRVSDFSAIRAEDEVTFPPGAQFRVKGVMSGGSMALLAQAMEVDLTNISVYELREVHLSTCDGLLSAFSEKEVTGLPQVVRFLRHGGEAKLQSVDAGLLLSLAVQKAQHHAAVVELTLSAGVDVPRADRNYYLVSRFVSAITTCSTPILSALHRLVDSRADVNRTQPFKNTPLIDATASSLPEVTDLLLKAGADVNARGQYQRTALTYAAAGGDTPTVRLLLTAGADPCMCDLWQRTPLYWAERHDKVQTAEVLKESGCDQHTLDHPLAETPEELARRADTCKAEWGNVSYILTLGWSDWQILPPHCISGLLSILHGSKTSNQLLIRAAVLAVTRLLGTPDSDDQEEGAATQGSKRSQASYRNKAVRIFKKLWVTNENSNVRDTAELGLKVIGGPEIAEYVVILQDVTGALGTDITWNQAPPNFPRPGDEIDWLEIQGYLCRADQRRRRVYTIVLLLSQPDLRVIPTSFWSVLADELGDDQGDRLVVQAGFDAILHRFEEVLAVVPPQVVEQLVEAAQVQFTHSVVRDVRARAQKVWQTVLKELDLTPFAPHYLPTVATNPEEARGAVLRLADQLQLRGGLMDALAAIPGYAQQHDHPINSAFAAYYTDVLCGADHIFEPLLALYYWLLILPKDDIRRTTSTGSTFSTSFSGPILAMEEGAEGTASLPSVFISKLLESGNRFERYLGLLYIGLHRSARHYKAEVKRLAVQDLISDVRDCARWALQSDSITINTDLRSSALDEEKMALMEVYAHRCTDC